MTHKLASSFEIHRRLDDSHTDRVNDIAVQGDFFVTCSDDQRVKIWDSCSLTLRRTLKCFNKVPYVDVCDKNIVTASLGGEIRFTQIDEKMSIPSPYSLGKTDISDVSFLNDDVVALSVGSHLYFISLSSKSVLSQVRTEKKLSSFTVLRDGRIAVGGVDGYCAIISLPSSVQGAVND